MPILTKNFSVYVGKGQADWRGVYSTIKRFNYENFIRSVKIGQVTIDMHLIGKVNHNRYFGIKILGFFFNFY